MRAEQLERLRRRILKDNSRGIEKPPDWDDSRPWTALFNMAAEDKSYWDEQVRDIATAWLSRGRAGTLQSPDELFAAENLQEVGGAAVMHAPTEASPGNEARNLSAY